MRGRRWCCQEEWGHCCLGWGTGLGRYGLGWYGEQERLGDYGCCYRANLGQFMSELNHFWLCGQVEGQERGRRCLLALVEYGGSPLPPSEVLAVVGCVKLV